MSKENDAYKKLIELSGLSKNLFTPGSSVGITPGNVPRNFTSPTNSTPTVGHINPVFTQFFNKLENSVSGAPATGRVSVFSPPVNGKIGGIPRSSSPSPSTALKNLKLSSANNLPQPKQVGKEKFLTPTCSQESDYIFSLPYESSQSITSSPAEVWNASNNPGSSAYHLKKDPRRVVVHPYSPNE